MKIYHFCFSLMLIMSCGCMHTVVGGGGDSPDKCYRLWVSSHGASGKSYVDKSKKKLWVSISSGDGTNSAVLFQQRYDLVGSDIEWKTHWVSDEVSVVFYDWGDGVSNYSNMKHLKASNHVASLSFRRDPTTGKFIEKK